jgi:hypothetical protein
LIYNCCLMECSAVSFGRGVPKFLVKMLQSYSVQNPDDWCSNFCHTTADIYRHSFFTNKLKFEPHSIFFTQGDRTSIAVLEHTKSYFLIGDGHVEGSELNLTFRGPCILIYSYNKSQRGALFLQFILVKNSTCFGQIYLSIIRSFNTVYTAKGICHSGILKLVKLLVYIQ